VRSDRFTRICGPELALCWPVGPASQETKGDFLVEVPPGTSILQFNHLMEYGVVYLELVQRWRSLQRRRSGILVVRPKPDSAGRFCTDIG